MTGTSQHRHASWAGVARKSAAVVILCGWFSLPLVYMWGAWEISSFEPRQGVASGQSSQAHWTIGFAAVGAFVLPLAALQLEFDSTEMRTLARVQLLVSFAVVAFLVISRLRS